MNLNGLIAVNVIVSFEIETFSCSMTIGKNTNKFISQDFSISFNKVVAISRSDICSLLLYVISVLTLHISLVYLRCTYGGLNSIFEKYKHLGTKENQESKVIWPKYKIKLCNWCFNFKSVPDWFSNFDWRSFNLQVFLSFFLFKLRDKEENENLPHWINWYLFLTILYIKTRKWR